MAHSFQHLWRQIRHRSAERFCTFVAFEDAFFRETEISKLRMAIKRDNDVIRLQISINDVSFVQIFKSEQNLTNVGASSLFWQFSLLLQDFAEIATGAEI